MWYSPEADVVSYRNSCLRQHCQNKPQKVRSHKSRSLFWDVGSDDVFLPGDTIWWPQGENSDTTSADSIISQYRPQHKKLTSPHSASCNRFCPSDSVSGTRKDYSCGSRSGHLGNGISGGQWLPNDVKCQVEVDQSMCPANCYVIHNQVPEENSIRTHPRHTLGTKRWNKNKRRMSFPYVALDDVIHEEQIDSYLTERSTPLYDDHLIQRSLVTDKCITDFVPTSHDQRFIDHCFPVVAPSGFPRTRRSSSDVYNSSRRKLQNASEIEHRTFLETDLDQSLEYSDSNTSDIMSVDEGGTHVQSTRKNSRIKTFVDHANHDQNNSPIPNHVLIRFCNSEKPEMFPSPLVPPEAGFLNFKDRSIGAHESHNVWCFARYNSDPGYLVRTAHRRLSGTAIKSSRLHEQHSQSPLLPASSARYATNKDTIKTSFGRRSQGCTHRISECLTLEASDMIVIDFPDAATMKSATNSRTVVSNSQIEHLLNNRQTHDTAMRRLNSDSVLQQLQEELACGSQSVFCVGNQFPPPGCLEQPGNKRLSRSSDTSSAYSGSDIMHTSLDEPDVDLSGLTKSLAGSDDEDGYAESAETFSIRDAERDCLEKEPSERTEEDIQVLLNFTQHFKAFSNMTEHTRRLLCEVMVFAIVPMEGTIVMKDGEELDSWSVILNGEVEITRPNGINERLQMGDSFGIRPTMEKLHHQGVMRTVVNDCQFVCIAQSNYYRILHQGEENIKQHEEKGKVVMVTEHRELDGGEKKGHIVIRGTSERLMQHLIESHSAIDPNYVDDFLLTYRTFLKSPLDLVKHLLGWFQNDELKTSVTRVVLLWVNNHFNDFETNPDMCDFLEHFECLLEREKMMGQLTLLNMACAAKARVRSVTLTRATREEMLNFSILGGLERNFGIFVTKVQAGSKAAEAGLKRGDQILEVNGHKFHQIYYNKALEILRGTTHLSITVKSNLQEFKEMLRASDKVTPRKVKREDGNIPNPKQRLSVPDLDSAVPMFHLDLVDEKKTEKRGGIFGTTSKLRKALTRINFMPKNLIRETGPINHSDESLYSKPSRKSSTSSSSSNPGSTLSSHLSASNPDITLAASLMDDRSDIPEHAVKVFKSDQSFKYLLIHKETAAKEVVMLALQEFGVTEPSSNYSLCEVTVEMEKFIKSKRLPDCLNNLSERLNLNGRYYLKNNLTTEQLIPDDLIGQLLSESQISLLQLNTHEIAWQLTLNDYRVFCEIEPTEYIDDLYDLDSKYGCHQLHKFAELVNKEMFWVVTEICSETNLLKRTKLLKHFIEIAKHCKDSKNFNSMFAILSGLGHGSVSRLKCTWERLPGKYTKLFEDLQSLMDPSRNMAKYRNLINSEHVQPPYIPFYPIFKKDLTFIHLGNDSYIDGLVNFEKLRMVAKEVRHICNICSTKYDSSNMFLSTNNSFQSALVSGMATLKRTKNRRCSAMPNAKKMYEEAQMVRRVISYLSNMPSIADEDKITELSNLCEPSVKKRDQSPSINNSPNMEDKRVMAITGPKFGAESPGAVRKLMALSDKVKPHDPKVPVGKVVSPSSNRRIPPLSPRIGPSRLVPVTLTTESTCLGQGSRTRHVRMGSLSSVDSQSSSGSIRGMKNQYSSENDSGHGSISSSVSPQQHRRLTAPAGPIYCSVPGPPSQVRPPLPSLNTVIHHSTMSAPVVTNYSSYPAFPGGRRPPLPDYESATTMAQLAKRQQQQHNWSYPQDNKSYTGVNHGSVTSPGSDSKIPPAQGPDEEQVSAV